MVARSTETAPDHAAGGIIAPEIAARYGRELSTIQRQWMVRPEWPASIGKRGRWNEYDAAEVEQVVRAHFVRAATPASEGGPDDLLTVAQIAEYTGLAEATVRADISRGRINRQADDDSEGVKRWRRSTIDAAMRGRRRYARR
ncbi:hypothetical protein [Nocardia abscessus]|uniref:hypothetical protein n=1 Tax=Nocardia abscessus TaxID=120957 RepID=UPI0024553ED1|nr:hypothetical protein [Nocardia abscessus]